jgi:hypothetical protein
MEQPSSHCHCAFIGDLSLWPIYHLVIGNEIYIAYVNIIKAVLQCIYELKR